LTSIYIRGIIKERKEGNMKLSELIKILTDNLEQEGDTEILGSCFFCQTESKDVFVFTKKGEPYCDIGIGELEND
jgi:hypothetical protein